MIGNYTCIDNTFISALELCDGKNDCPEGEDESDEKCFIPTEYISLTVCGIYLLLGVLVFFGKLKININ